MIYKKIEIDTDYEDLKLQRPEKTAFLEAFILDNEAIKYGRDKKRPAVIVCPGGGYAELSPREAEPIALKYCGAGFHSFVLNYSVSPAGWPAAIGELSKAVKYVKSIADEHKIDKDKIFVCGFSAGGHLAASLAVHYNHPDVVNNFGIKNEENKPAGVILGYPVITAGKNTHGGTIDNFSAGRDDVRKLASLEKFVTPDTLPAFIWHTRTDEAVPVYNSIAFAAALEENGVDFELHIYPEGCHGLALSNHQTGEDEPWIKEAPQNWIDMSVRWINDFKK